MTYLQHPLSAAFPAMTDAEFQELKDSIKNNGVLNAITILDDMVLDGWHRYKAANELGMPCPEVQFDEDLDPKDFVLAQNKNRRHITAAQLAMATTAVYQWWPANRPNKGAPSAHLSKTTSELAEIAGTSERTIKQAKAVTRDAEPEVLEAVKSGKIGLKKAGKIAKLPKDQQAAAIDKPFIEKPRMTEEWGPDEKELAAAEFAAQADRDLLDKMLQADDALAVSHAENVRLNALVASLEVRINSLMIEKNEAIKDAKRAQAQLDKIQKAKK